MKTANYDDKLIVMGASTGGTKAIKRVLEQLGPQIPPVLIVQHIPGHFSRAFAERLNKALPYEVREAQDGDLLVENRILVAPGGKQMRLVKKGNQHCINIEDSPAVNQYKPSVDYLFESVSLNCEKNVIALILTGMGSDGTEGLLRLKKYGAYTIAQNEKSSKIFDSSREFVKREAAMEVCRLKDMGRAIQNGFYFHDLQKLKSS